jgi:peptidyl-prolyl cis-trans isomerase C
MPPRPRTRLALAAVMVALLASAACKKKDAKSGGSAGGGDKSSDSRPVAKIDDTVITVGDVQDRINKQAPFTRGRYAALEKRKELLDSLIRVEVMAKEAEKRGYDKDPEVVRVKKQQMISRFLQKDFESKLKVEDVPAAEVEKYYKEHPEEFNRPEEVRVSQILVKDKAKADKVAALARAAAQQQVEQPPAADGSAGARRDRPAQPLDRADRNDPKAFRDLVTKFSEDEDSKARGGDLTSFEKTSTLYPKPVIDAAFELKEVGDISPPIKTDQGYHVLRLTQKRPGFSRPLPEVKRQIQQRTKALDNFVADLRKKYSVTIDDDNLAKVTIEAGPGDARGMNPGGPGGPGGPPGGGPGLGTPGMPHDLPGRAVPPRPTPSGAPTPSPVTPAPVHP